MSRFRRGSGGVVWIGCQRRRSHVVVMIAFLLVGLVWVAVTFSSSIVLDGTILSIGYDDDDRTRIQDTAEGDPVVTAAPAITHHKDKILVVYSGPTAILDTNGTGIAALKNDLYIKNFEYFVRNGGVDCHHHDTVLVVTEQVRARYRDEIAVYQEQACSSGEHFVKIVARENICYDMESVRLVMDGLVDGVNVTNYDYFIYANCGTSGPARRDARWQSHWTQEFLQRFDHKVRLVGVSHNCYPVQDYFRPHMQSIAYALDRQGIQLVVESGAVYDCRKGGRDKGSVIERYEVGMSKYIMNSGYAVRSIMRDMTLTNYTAPCEGNDIWMTQRLKDSYQGRVPSINETIFFKTSRVLTDEIAKLINFTQPIIWNW